MAFGANILNTLGVVLLCHAVYSAYEHSLLPSTSAPTRASGIFPRSLDPKIDLPPDITLETIISILMLCMGVVLSSRELEPIQWNVWAGRLERSKQARKYEGVGQGGGNPYAMLEERTGFLDVRGKRKEFALWLRDGAQASK